MKEQKPRINDFPGEGEPNAGNPSENFLLIVTAIIRNAEGKILLQKRADPDIPAFWSLNVLMLRYSVA